MQENEKFDAIIKEIIRLNPDIETSKEIMKVLTYHITMKKTIQESLDYARWAVN